LVSTPRQASPAPAKQTCCFASSWPRNLRAEWSERWMFPPTGEICRCAGLQAVGTFGLPRSLKFNLVKTFSSPPRQPARKRQFFRTRKNERTLCAPPQLVAKRAVSNRRPLPAGVCYLSRVRTFLARPSFTTCRPAHVDATRYLACALQPPSILPKFQVSASGLLFHPSAHRNNLHLPSRTGCARHAGHPFRTGAAVAPSCRSARYPRGSGTQPAAFRLSARVESAHCSSG
jgi:hypothetical protein